MADQDRTQTHSRVYHVDRECYIVYVGSQSHRYRPFLRIGTSARLPAQIKRHIGSVVISDRLTGDPSEEHDCLEKPVSHNMHYVGTRDLVAAVKQYLHEKSIQAISLDESKKAIEHAGTYVVFYDDGNFRLFMDGHRLFDLEEREQADQHGVTILRRLEQIIGGSAGAYAAEDFGASGFIPLADGSILGFSDGELEARQLSHEAHAAMARRLIPISLLRNYSGPTDRNLMVTLAKSHIVRGTTASVATASKSDRQTRDFIALFKQAGLQVSEAKVEGETADRPDLRPSPRRGFCPCEVKIVQPESIASPENAPWIGATPPLVSGIPYRYTDSFDRVTLDDTYLAPLRRIVSDRTRRRIDGNDPVTVSLLSSIAKDSSLPPSDRLAVTLLAWNLAMTEAIETGELKNPPQPDEEQLVSLIAMAPTAIIADIVPTNDGWVLFYTIPARFTLGRINDNRRAIEKIDAYLARQSNDEHFAEERRLVLELLERLIQEDTIEKVQPPPPPKDAQTAEPAKDSSPDLPGRDGDTSRGSGESGSTAARSDGSPGRSPESRRSRRRGLIAAAAVLLALGLAAFIFRDQLGSMIADPAPTVIAENQETADDQIDGGSETSEPLVIDQPTDEELARLVPGGAGLDTVFVTGAGGFSITIRDILTMVNRIAVTNGYDMIGEASPGGFDPDWIFPDSLILMPNVEILMIERGDTLWWISHDFLLDSLIDHNREFTILRQRVEDGERPVDDIRDLERRVYVTSIRNELATMRNQM